MFRKVNIVRHVYAMKQMLLEFVLTILCTYVFVWNQKKARQLTTVLEEWLFLMRYHTELKSELCDFKEVFVL